MHREKMRSGWSRLLCLLFCFCMLLGGCASANKTGGEKKAQVEETKDGEDGKAKADLGAKEEIKLDESCVKEIKERGYLIVGCKTDVPGLGYYDEKEDSWSGLEVELAYQSAACIFEVSLEEAKEQERVRFVGVTVADREEKLKEGEVDCRDDGKNLRRKSKFCWKRRDTLHRRFRRKIYWRGEKRNDAENLFKLYPDDERLADSPNFYGIRKL